MKRPHLILLALSALFLIFCSANKQMQTYGEEPSLTKPAQIAELNANPAAYVEQDVLVSGTVVDMCMHAGCWVEIEQKDHSKILCKSMDESVTFPPTTLGKEIELQGTLRYDENAPGTVQEGEGEEAHACPQPTIMVAIKGARVRGL